MEIEHIAFYALDIERCRAFYEKYFTTTTEPKYQNTRGLTAYFLNFAAGCRLEIMHRPEVRASEKNDHRDGYIHIAIRVGDRAAVDALTERMRADGVKIVSEPRLTGTGGYESCVYDPENNLVELTD